MGDISGCQSYGFGIKKGGGLPNSSKGEKGGELGISEGVNAAVKDSGGLVGDAGKGGKVEGSELIERDRKPSRSSPVRRP